MDIFYGTKKYILAEKRGDSLQLWYGIIGKEMSEVTMQYETETISIKNAKANHCTLKKISRNRIVTNEMKLQSTRNLKKYFTIRNEIIAKKIETDYDAEVIKIRTVYTGTNKYFANKGNRKTTDSLKAYCRFNTFETEYRKFIFSNLTLVHADIKQKQILYENLKNKTIIADSLLFKTFLNNYQNGTIDNKILYYILVNNPELFYLRKMNVDFIFGDIILYCNECFTKEEKETMYQSLKPFRYKCPAILFMFDQIGQHQGYIDY